MDTEVLRPKYLHNVQHLPTSPSRDEEAKRTRYRKFLKIRTLVFFVLVVCFLSLGIFLLVRYNQPNGSSVARSCGILFTVLGVAFAITTSVYCPTFIKLIASRSGSVVYHPKSAEALTKMRYPRHKVEKMPPIPPPMATTELPRVLPPAPFPTGMFVEPSAPPPYSEVEKMQY
ncbi:metacestode specific membrane protein 1 [Echinococcus multilocularis]|uniref:Metacestode specific membrane protein 1 n=1 Tax=Echinococcus multilocularis TaxID=6211 RepID=A0A068Y216_ECHMU|nr:metacestode specific membrane protein 1 [Echinococcus multilocularis]